MKFAGKSKAKNRFKNLNSDFRIEPAGPGGKIPALTMSTGLSTGGVDLPVDLPVDTACRARRMGAPDLVFWLGLGWVLEIS